MSTPEPESIALPLQQPGVASKYLSDMVIAKSIAQGVLRLAGIVEMSASPVHPKATYGRGERVNGVVLRHTAAGASASPRKRECNSRVRSLQSEMETA